MLCNEYDLCFCYVRRFEFILQMTLSQGKRENVRYKCTRATVLRCLHRTARNDFAIVVVVVVYKCIADLYICNHHRWRRRWRRRRVQCNSQTFRRGVCWFIASPDTISTTTVGYSFKCNKAHIRMISDFLICTDIMYYMVKVHIMYLYHIHNCVYI